MSSTSIQLEQFLHKQNDMLHRMKNKDNIKSQAKKEEMQVQRGLNRINERESENYNSHL